MILLVANGLLGHQHLLDSRCDGGFCLKDIDDRHDAGLRFGSIRRQEFFCGLHGGLCDLQAFICKHHFPVGLFNGGDDGHDPVTKDMLLDHGIVLSDLDEGLVDSDAGVSEQRLREGERQTARPRGVEQESSGDILVDAASRRRIVDVEVAACDQIGLGINRHGVIALVKGGDLIQDADRSAEHGSIEWVDDAIVLAVDAQVGVELGLLDDDVGQSAFSILSAETDVEIVL